MLQPPPAQPGMREDEVDTPALLIDLDAFSRASSLPLDWIRGGCSNDIRRLCAHRVSIETSFREAALAQVVTDRNTSYDKLALSMRVCAQVIP